MNSNYGKLIDGVLTFAPINLVIDDMQVINASEDEYMSAGYLPIEYTPKPDDNHWQAVYTEVDGVVLQSWVYEGRIHDHSNLPLLEGVTAKSLSGVPAVHELPTDAKDGDMCLYAPMNTITLEDSGKRIYFDWEEFAKLIDSEGLLYAGAITNNINSWGGGLAVELAGFRSSTHCYMTIMLYTQIGTYTSYYIAFNNGQFDAENSSYQIYTGDTLEEHHFNSIDELPLYVTLPEFDFINAAENTAGNIFVFCTEYRLMKYQGGEWVEAAESGVTQAEMQEYVSSAISGKSDVSHTHDELATKEYVDSTNQDLKSQISSIPKFSISVVTELPTTDISTTTVYLLKTDDTEGNLYTEYVNVNGAWEELGTQRIDLEGYAKIEDIPTTDEIVAEVIAALPIAEEVDF